MNDELADRLPVIEWPHKKCTLNSNNHTLMEYQMSPRQRDTSIHNSKSWSNLAKKRKNTASQGVYNEAFQARKSWKNRLCYRKGGLLVPKNQYEEGKMIMEHLTLILTFCLLSNPFDLEHMSNQSPVVSCQPQNWLEKRNTITFCLSSRASQAPKSNLKCKKLNQYHMACATTTTQTCPLFLLGDDKKCDFKSEHRNGAHYQ